MIDAEIGDRTGSLAPSTPLLTPDSRSGSLPLLDDDEGRLRIVSSAPLVAPLKEEGHSAASAETNSGELAAAYAVPLSVMNPLFDGAAKLEALTSST